MRVTLGHFSVPEGWGNVGPSLVMAKGRFKDDSRVLQSQKGGHNMVACILALCSLCCLWGGWISSSLLYQFKKLSSSKLTGYQWGLWEHWGPCLSSAPPSARPPLLSPLSPRGCLHRSLLVTVNLWGHFMKFWQNSWGSAVVRKEVDLTQRSGEPCTPAWWGSSKGRGSMQKRLTASVGFYGFFFFK